MKGLGQRHGDRRLLISMLAVLSCLAFAGVANQAQAFCGFYVSGGTADLYNSATMVVLMRDGTRTVLSMQNNYEGPPEDFALVVPVPAVLSEDEVKVLSADVFDRIDQMAAPRLVEYWEADPCNPYLYSGNRATGPPALMMASEAEVDDDGGAYVVVEAEFEVGEYDIVILSSNDSSALDGWLRENGYNIPAGAEEALRPYIESEMKFFVARVNVERVTFAGGRAELSPLRFHYDSDSFSLPIRLGLLNASGAQDLIVHILAPGQRYEVANYDNVSIPTNYDVAEAARDNFAAFYAQLFDKTLEHNPGAVVTEYAWNAGTCDPCPGPALTRQDFLTLGADVISLGSSSFVLTRLHSRYTSETLGEDLVFSAAPPITGGREVRNLHNELEHGSTPGSVNNFQGRYAIRHPWEGPVACETPVYGQWGGPDGRATGNVDAALDLAFAPRGDVELADYFRQGVPEIQLAVSELSDPLPAREPREVPEGLPLASSDLPFNVTGSSGGAVNLRSRNVGGCIGFIAESPNHVLEISEQMTVSIRVTSSVDTTLVISGPNGMLCNDDFDVLNPGFASTTLSAGTYEIYVGNYSQSAASTPYALVIRAP